jgi:hypothetical protein
MSVSQMIISLDSMITATMMTVTMMALTMMTSMMMTLMTMQIAAEIKGYITTISLPT